MLKKRIVISGAGPAGLSLALLLDKDVYDITLVERSKSFRTVGYSIILWEAGQQILQRIAGDEVDSILHPLDTFTVYGGEKLQRLQSSSTHGFGFSVAREDLMSILSKNYLKKFGKNSISFNNSIDSIQYKDNGSISMTLSNRSVLDADLLIAADGMHSAIRNQHFIAKLQSDPFKITYCWLNGKNGLKNEAIIGFMQNFLLLMQTAGDKTLLAYYNYGNNKDAEKFLKSVDTMLARDFNGRLEIDTTTSKDFVSETVSVQKPYDRKVVLVGDALHGHPPTLAMGTSLALEDSFLLASQLNTLRTASQFEKKLASVLETYSREVTNRSKKVYLTQDLVEKLLITSNKHHIKTMETVIKYGGWKYLDYTLRKLFSATI